MLQQVINLIVAVI